MNNNFKKLLASAMALAMVTSVMPAGVSAAYDTIRVESPSGARQFITKLNKALAKVDSDVNTVKEGQKITFDGDEVDIFSFENTTNGFKLNDTLLTQIKLVLGSLDEEDEEYVVAEYLYNLPTALTTMVNATNDCLFNQMHNLLLKVDEEKGLTVAQYKEAVEIMEEVNKFASYEGNLVEKREHGKYFGADEYLEKKELLEGYVSDFISDNYGDELDDYIGDLEKYFAEFTENDETPVTKKAIDKAIKDIKSGDAVVSKKTNGATDDYISKANYVAFGEDEAVVAILEQFEELYGGAEATVDALSAKNEATVAYKKDKAYYNGTDKETLVSYVNSKEYKVLLSNINSDTFEILSSYKEEVLDAIYELDEKQYGNVYVDKSVKTIFVTTDEVKKVIADLSTSDVKLTDFADKEEGVRYYDELAARVEAVQEDLEAITTGLKGITVNNITSKNVAKVEAAEEALERLTSTGKYNGNLTAEEAKTVKNNQRHVRALVDRMYNDGIVSQPQDWWVKEDGQWVFYKDGKVQEYVWVASNATDWYYAGKNGKMLRSSWIARDSKLDVWYYVNEDGLMVRNTTVDGCYIDANGEWHA